MSVCAQPHIDVVNKTLNGASVDNMIRYFDNVVDITMNNEQSTYSKSQAQMVIRNFFSKNAVKIFRVLQSGQRNETTFFIVGDVNGGPRSHYRVFLFFKQKGTLSLLQQIKFEQVKD